MAVVRLADLIGDDLIVRGRTFVDDLILGPAVAALLGGIRMTLCTFGCEDVEQIIWEVPDDAVKVGCIGVADCVFEHCTFQAIGFTGPAEMMRLLRACPP